MTNPEDLVAFVDESHRPVRDRKTGKADLGRWHYVVAAAVVFRTDLAQCRKRLINIEDELGFGLHYHDLKSRSRRTAAVDAICEMVEWEGYVFEDPKPIAPGGGFEQTARERQLSQAFPFLESLGVGRAVLETRVRSNTKRATLDDRDRALAVGLRQHGKIQDGFHIEHTGKGETILKIADVVASCRTDFLCVRDETIFPRIAHRLTVEKTETRP